MDQTLQEFLTQSWKSLMRLDTAVATLERGSLDSSALERIFGVVRAIREQSGPLHLVGLHALARAVEVPLEMFRAGTHPSPQSIEVVLEAVEAIKASIVAIEATRQEQRDENGGLRARLKRLVASRTSAIDANKTDELSDPPIQVQTSWPEIICAEDIVQTENHTDTPAQAEVHAGSYVVNPQVPDDLMELVDELKWAQDQLRDSLPDAASKVHRQEIAQFDRITDELRQTVATIWLQPTLDGSNPGFDCGTPSDSGSRPNVRQNATQSFDSRYQLPSINKSTLAGLNVLVIDSSLFFRHLAMAALQSAGSKVTAVKNVLMAVEALSRGEQFDAVLVDVDLPEVQKREIAAWTTDADRRVPLIALASWKTTTDQSRIRQAGFDRCVAKFHTRRLVAAIAELCLAAASDQACA
jgi:CheY-like chemotaxis protein